MPMDDPLAPGFTRLLHEAADLAPAPPAADLAEAARRRHRRHRRRQGAALLGGCAAVVALAVLAGPLLPGGGGRATVAGPVAGEWPAHLEDRFMSDTLIALLPPGTVGSSWAQGPNDGPERSTPPAAHVVFDDGKGAGMVNLTVGRAALPITDTTRGTQCADAVERPVEGCERTVLPDGGIVVIDKLAPVEPMKVREWRITYTGPDGRQVSLWEVNSTVYGPPLTRAAPPLSSEQLTVIATSKAWDPVFAGGRTSTVAPAPVAAAEFRPDEIVTTAVAMLPPETRSDPGAPQHTPGKGHLTVEREGRTSMLAVTVTPRPLDSAEVAAAAQSFRRSVSPAALTQLPDGTLVQLHTMGASKSDTGPTLRWLVDALHPDGTRVMVSEWNGKDDTETLPGTPALTVDQLKAIATFAAWRR
ncbi:hypothetical protein [Kitasatospora sp. NPDC101183]|uniref:hypothetical protein n=1 Tax=Kitasatospora sp. NPDC101183 TaxID=3364100 RepID=UPI00381C5FD7